MTLYNNDKATMSIVAGSDGSLHSVYDIKRNADIKGKFDRVFKRLKETGYTEQEAKLKATDVLYKLDFFEYEVK